MDETTEALNPETQPSGEAGDSENSASEDSAEEESGKKGLFGRKKKPKKEKQPKEKKPKKEKQPKEKKPKKEKQPKPKKEKKPKPKKEKKPKPAKTDAKSGGGSKLTVLLIPLAMLIVGAAAGMVLGSRMSLANRAQTEQNLEDIENPEEDGEETEEAEEPSEPKPFVGPMLPAVMRDPMDAANLTLTNKEAANYLLGISPANLGLEGDTMSDYDILPTGSLTPVDGQMCTEVRVYTRNNTAGTAQFLGMYLVSQTTPHRIFKLNPDTREITEVDRYS